MKLTREQVRALLDEGERGRREMERRRRDAELRLGECVNITYMETGQRATWRRGDMAKPTADEIREPVARLRAMATDDGSTWDLSPNDQAAITAVLASMQVQAVESDFLLTRLAEVHNERDKARAALREAHFALAAIVLSHEESAGKGLTIPADEIEAVPPDAEVVTENVGRFGRSAISVRVRSKGQ